MSSDPTRYPPVVDYRAELKLWAIRAVAVALIAIVTTLLQRWGVPVHVDPPPPTPPTPLKVVIQPGPDPSDPFTGAKAFAVPVSVEGK